MRASRIHVRWLIGMCIVVSNHALSQLPSSGPLDELTLSAADLLLQAGNFELQAARRTVEAAQADILSAGARPNPLLSTGVGAINPRAGIGGGQPQDRTVNTFVRLDQLIERGNKRELRIDNARSLEDATQRDLINVLRQQRIALAEAYYKLLLAQDRVAIAIENAGLFGETIRAAEQRLKAGDVAGADLARIRVDALRAQNDLRLAEADRVQAQISLGYLIGAGVKAAKIRAADLWPSMQQSTGSNLHERIERRPDVRAAIARIAAAQSGRELARSLRTRDISIGGQFDHFPTSPTNQNGSGNSVGFSVSVPLFVRYSFEGEITRAETTYSAALDGAERVRAQARAELSALWEDLQASADRLRRYDTQLLVEARRAAEYAEFAYRNGATGIMDLLDSRRVLRATQVDSGQARADYARALASWNLGIAAESSMGIK